VTESYFKFGRIDKAANERITSELEVLRPPPPEPLASPLASLVPYAFYFPTNVHIRYTYDFFAFFWPRTRCQRSRMQVGGLGMGAAKLFLFPHPLNDPFVQDIQLYWSKSVHSCSLFDDTVSRGLSVTFPL
jgi:hypothetical protein